MKKFDSYLKTADKKQKIMIIIIFIVIVGFLLNQFVAPMLEKQNELQSSVNAMQLKLSRNSTHKLKQQISKKTKKLLMLKDELDIEKEKINFVMSNIYKIKYASFDEMRWANTLDGILKYSVDKNIKIISLKSSDIKDETKNIFKLKKNIIINGVGQYKNILALVQYIENFKTLTDFKTINMSLVKEGVEFTMELNTYGVGL